MPLKLTVGLCSCYKSGEVFIVIVFRWLLTIDIMIEATGDLLHTEILQDAWAASVIVVHRVEWTIIVRACAEFLRILHDVLLDLNVKQ